MKKKLTHAPVILTPDSTCSFNQFLQVAQGLGHQYIIYVQDTTGEQKTVWSCREEDVMGCFESFSELCHFGRIQPLSDAMERGFNEVHLTNHR